MKTLRSILIGVAFVPMLLGATCFESPVKERIDVRILEGDKTVVTVAMSLAVAAPAGHEPELDRRVQERVEETRRSLLEGHDEWTSRFERADPIADRAVWEKEGGQLSRVDRNALLDSPAGLKRFFADTLVDVSFRQSEQWSELEIHAAAGTRASSQQRRQAKDGLADWSSSVSEYLVAARDLYAYLENNPERAEACFSKLFADIQSLQGDRGESGTSKEEERLIAPLGEAMEGLLGVFTVPSESSYSIEEISRIAYDPFPAPLTIRVTGNILEVEGFDAHGKNGRFRVPPISFFGALQRLEGRWLSPDPFLVYYAHVSRGTEDPVDIKPLLTQPRRATRAVTADEVRRAIEDQLAPAPVYRVRWRRQAAVEETHFEWKRIDLGD